MIAFGVAMAVIALLVGVGVYQLRQYRIATDDRIFWMNQGKQDAEEGKPYDAPTNLFSAQHYREGYYPIKRPPR